MDRTEFMRQLEGLLSDISSAEREEALRYYNNYFDDAGSENEQQVIEALGSPDRVAENIKSGLFESGIAEVVQQGKGGDVPYGESGHVNIESGRTDKYSGYTEPHPAAERRKEGYSAASTVLIVLLCVLASPILIPAAIGILCVLFGVLTAWFAIIFGFGVVAVALFAVLVFLIVLGCMCFVAEPLVSVALMGGGLVCGGIAILFLMLTVAMAGIVTPAFFRGIGWIFRPLKRVMA